MTVLLTLPKGRVRELAITSLNYDPRYSPPVHEPSVRAIMAEFFGPGFRPPHVFRYENKLWVVDGKQSVEAARRLGLRKVRCHVLTGYNYRVAAEAYVLCNAGFFRNRQAERFQAELAAGLHRAGCIYYDTLKAGFRIKGVSVPPGHRDKRLLELEAKHKGNAPVLHCTSALEVAFCGSSGVDSRSARGKSGRLAHVLELLPVWQPLEGWLCSSQVYALTELVKMVGSHVTRADLERAVEARGRREGPGDTRYSPAEVRERALRRLCPGDLGNRSKKDKELANEWMSLLGLERRLAT